MTSKFRRLAVQVSMVAFVAVAGASFAVAGRPAGAVVAASVTSTQMTDALISGVQADDHNFALRVATDGSTAPRAVVRGSTSATGQDMAAMAMHHWPVPPATGVN